MIEVTRQGAVDVIHSDQPASGEQATCLADALRKCLAAGQPFTVFNLQHVTLLDSVGLELLLDAKDAFETRGGTLKLAGGNALCRDILRVSGVAEQFEMYADVKSAVGSFAK